MREHLTHAIEDYLKAIYAIAGPAGRASTNQLAERLNVTPASVTGMVKKLAATDPPLVEHERHHGVSLTEEGERVALEILRHHRLLELYLYQILGFSWDKVHAEADRLEHVISEEFEARIAAALGHPQRDPHGDPIPGADLRLPPTPSLALSALRDGDTAVILRVGNADPELLCYLEAKGLIPNSQLRVIAHSPFDEILTMQLAGSKEPIALGPAITNQIFVEKL